MFSSIARLATRHPWRIVTAMAVVAASALAFSAGLTDRLSTQGFANRDAESYQVLDKIAEVTGADTRAEVIALVDYGHKIDSPRGRKLVAKVKRKLDAERDLKTVKSPFDGGDVDKTLISRDGKAAIVTGNLKDGTSEGDSPERLREAFAEFDNVKLGGTQMAQHMVSETIETDLRRAEMLAFPLLFLLALFVFRGLIAALLPMLVGIITIPVTFALIGFADRFTDLSVFALNLTTGMGLGLAIDYSLLMVTRFREELATGADEKTAIKRTVATAGRTVAFSALTVAGATSALMIFPLKFLYSMGVGGATVALVSAAVALTLLPAMLMLLGRRVDRFGIPRRSAEHSMSLWHRLATIVMKRPTLVAVATTAILLAMALPAARIAFTSVDATVLAANAAPRIVQEAVDHDFPKNDSNSSIFVVVESKKYDPLAISRRAKRVKRDARKVARDGARVKRDATTLQLAMLTPGADPAHLKRESARVKRETARVRRASRRVKKDTKRLERSADRLDAFEKRIDRYRARIKRLSEVNQTRKPVVLGKGTWKFEVFARGERYGSDAQLAVKQIRAVKAPTANRWVGGSSASFVDQRDSIVKHTPYALALIGLITFVALFMMTGSVVLPIKTFVMNLLTLGATFGMLVAIFQDNRLEGLLDYEGQGALELTQPVLLFAIAFGLATDYGVFLLSRVKELHDGGMSNHDAVAHGVARTGRVISSAAVLFCVAVLSFSTSGIVFIKELGVGAALAVAIDASIVRALLVPALMAILGKANWWAPGWMRRLHNRIGVSEGPSAGGAELAFGGAGLAGQSGVGAVAALGSVGGSVPGGLADGRGNRVVVDNGEQRVYNLRVELGAGVSDHLGSGLLETDRLTIGPVGDHRVEGVAHQNDAAGKRDVVARNAVWVALAVPALVFVANRFRNR